MNLLPVFNFIVHHFVQARVSHVVILNCWALTSQLDFLRYANDNLLRIQMVDISNAFKFPGQNLDGAYTVLGILLDSNCSGSSKILNESSELQLFTGKHNWLIVNENPNNATFRETFEDKIMSIDAQITYAALDKSYSNDTSKSFVLYDVYNNGKNLGAKLNITLDKRVTCGPKLCFTTYLSDLHLRLKYGNRCNLNDTTFRITTVVSGVPLNSSTKLIIEKLSSTADRHVDTLLRYAFSLVLIVRDIINYNVTYIHRTAWSVNETAGGTFGDLVQGNAELSATAFIPTVRRLNHLSAILHIGAFRSIFLFRTDHNGGLYGDVFLSPFSGPVWVGLVTVIVLFAVIFWAIFAIEFHVLEHIKFIPSLLTTFLMSFGLACVQDAPIVPRTIGGRMAFFSLSVVTFIMYNYYTSTVVSSLVGAPIKSNIKTLEQLANSSFEIGIEPAPYTISYLNSSMAPEIKQLLQKKLGGRVADDSSYWIKAEEGILKVRDGGYAYHAEASTAYRLIEKSYEQHELCDLNEVKLRAENSLATMMNKGSAYKEIVRLSLTKMQQSGLISRQQRFWMKTKLHCFSNNILINVGLEYTGPLFALLGIFYVITLVILIMEIIYHRYVSEKD